MSRCRASLGWASLLLLGALLACLPSPLLGEKEANCGTFINCTSCISQLSCTWYSCNETRNFCANSTANSTDLVNCTHTSHNGSCSVIPTPTPEANKTTTFTPTPGNLTSPTSPKVTPTANATVTTPPATTASSATKGPEPPKPTAKPSPHKSTFDAASFIGGIVLVLGLQAVIFFLYKFCKSKEQNYHTL
ncbi:sialomucin core protein 24 [Tiliqua scincoides]|uniref:sialomucin core protein 24 n=1 Tax=Tiliqua scincoides TaxID=71010 RepID=UPI003461A628